MRRWLLLILFTKLVDAGSLLSLASFLAQTSLGAQNKSAQHFLSIELAFSGENNFILVNEVKCLKMMNMFHICANCFSFQQIRLQT